MLIFLYFLTLSADLLNIELMLFRVKANHLVALLLFVYFWMKQKNLRVDREIFYAFLLIALAFVLSALGSSYPLRSWGYVAVLFFNFLCYFLLPLNLVLQEDPKRIFRLYFLAFCCIGVYAVLQFFLSLTGVEDPFVQQKIGEWARPNALSFEPSYYALYMTSFVMFLNFYFLLGGIPGRRALWLLLPNLFLGISFSTGGFLCYFIFFVLAFLLCARKTIRIQFEGIGKRFLLLFVPFLSTLVIGVVILEKIFADYFFKFFTALFYEHFSFAARWEGIEKGFFTFLSNPFFGKGVGGVGPYLYQQEYPDSTDVSLISLEKLELFDPTNVTLEILASLGLFGFIAFIFLTALFVRRFRTLAAHSIEEKKVAYALFFSLIILILELQFNQNLFRSYIWVHAALTWGLLIKKESSFAPASQAL